MEALGHYTYRWTGSAMRSRSSHPVYPSSVGLWKPVSTLLPAASGTGAGVGQQLMLAAPGPRRDVQRGTEPPM